MCVQLPKRLASLRFYRAFEDWELVVSYSLLQCIQPCIPRGDRRDHWVMLGSVAGLLSCWYQWLEKHNSNIWNLIPRYLMWIVWLERNRRSFENRETTLDELKVLCQRSLFEWSRCWGFTDSSSLPEFMFSLGLSF